VGLQRRGGELLEIAKMLRQAKGTVGRAEVDAFTQALIDEESRRKG
jgi:hypothetical protein